MAEVLKLRKENTKAIAETKKRVHKVKDRR